jgi:hypothetical protein
VYVKRLGGGDERDVTRGSGMFPPGRRAAAASPSGTRIAISRLGRIWTIAPDGCGLRQVSNGPARAGNGEPSWQPR